MSEAEQRFARHTRAFWYRRMKAALERGELRSLTPSEWQKEFDEYRSPRPAPKPQDDDPKL